MPKVSVIVPIYKVKPFLRQCIDSIINQTLKDIEIILVDDGSVDGEAEICDEYAIHDKRIKVIHKNNEGLSAARNDGLDQATAPYIMFVDSDDWVEPEFCELPYTAAEKSKCDLVLFYHNRCYDNGRNERTNSSLQAGILKEEDAYFYNVFVTSCAWVALYNKRLFDAAKYPEGKYYEDIGTSHRLIHAANNVYLLDKVLYNHRIGRPNSITTAFETKDHSDKREMISKRANDLINWGFKECAFNDAFSLLIWYGCNKPGQERFTDIVKTGSTPASFSIKMKVLLTLFRISAPLFDMACIVTGRRIR